MKFKQLTTLILEAPENLPGPTDTPPASAEPTEPMEPVEDTEPVEETPEARQEDIELAKFAIRVANSNVDDGEVNHRIYDDWDKRKNSLTVLLYIENLLNKQESSEGQEQSEDNILRRLRHSGDEDSISAERLNNWARIILNALRLPSANRDFGEVTEETIDQIYDDLNNSYGHNNVRGDFGGNLPDSMTRSPGVF